MSKRVLLVGNSEIVIYKFRKELVEALISQGYHVTVAFPNMITDKSQYFRDLGCDFYHVEIDRRGINPITDLKLIRNFKKMIKQVNPDAIISYTIKPNIYLGLIVGNKNIKFYPNITGFGSAVFSGGLMKNILLKMYKLSFKNVTKVFVQNNSARELLLDENIVRDNRDIINLPGSGVSFNDFHYVPYPKETSIIKISYLGRIMKEKGIYEYIEAAKHIVNKYNNANCKVEFHAVGFVENNEKSDFLAQSNGFVQFHEYIDDVTGFVASSHLVVLPSYHEGMSNVLLEAAAIGRPLIASDIPGCKEIIDDGINGYLSKPQSTDSLVQALEKFLSKNHKEKEQMGKASRIKVEKEFDRDIVSERVISALIEGGIK